MHFQAGRKIHDRDKVTEQAQSVMANIRPGILLLIGLYWRIDQQ